jgi:hypothetical protein
MFGKNEIIAEVGLRFLFDQFRHGLAALLCDRAVVKPAIETASQISSAPGTLVPASDLEVRGNFLLAGMADPHHLPVIIAYHALLDKPKRSAQPDRSPWSCRERSEMSIMAPKGIQGTLRTALMPAVRTFSMRFFMTFRQTQLDSPRTFG